jgi:Family of unknown function (DUF5681)
MSEKPEGSYEVGYKKPPKATRYQKGKSGNRKGRPKKVDKALDLGRILLEVEGEPVAVLLENGKRRWMTKFEARLRELFTKAINGDLNAARLLVKMAEGFLAPEPDAPQQTEFLVQRDGSVAKN